MDTFVCTKVSIRSSYYQHTLKNLRHKKQKKYTLVEGCIVPFYFKRNLSLLRKAVAAINRTIVSRLKRNSGFTATGRTGCGEHFSRRCAAVFSGVAAGLASLGLVCKAFFSVELLLTCSENKLRATILTGQCFVLSH